MTKVRQRILIGIIIAMMIFTQIPTEQLIYALPNQLFEVGIADVDSDSKKIEVREVEEGITKIGLFLNDENIQTKDISDELSFVVHTNGAYEVRGFDANDVQKSEESIEVNSFEDFTVEKNAMTQEVEIVSRHDLTKKIVINQKDEVTAQETEEGYYLASYTIPENGGYTFSAVNTDGQEVASKTMEFTDIPNIGESGEFMISSEEDMKQISAHPAGTFVLESDIELTSNFLETVNFTGSLDGKGHIISGFTGSLFNSIKDATINNVVIKGALANTSTNSMIINTGFYVKESDDKKDSAVILMSDSTAIKHSFAFMNVEGNNVAGFILEGSGTIEHSYVSGYLKGNAVYGFGKNVDVKGSYISASLLSEERELFTKGNIEDCFYDAQINDVEELKATPMYTKDMVSKDFKKDEFKITEGQYPQIKKIEEMKEQAQTVSVLSAQSVKTDSNLSTLKGKVETKDSEGIKWNREKDEISAKSHDIMNRFALKEAKAVTAIAAGTSTSAKTTQITYPITMGGYYKVIKASEGSPNAPTSHTQAIEAGWKIMYWDGSYTQTGLDWNSEYDVYRTDLAQMVKDASVKTNYGKLGGKVTVTGTYDFGETITATLEETNTTKGTMYFETAPTLDALNWTTASTVVLDENTNSATYTVTVTDANQYLRARFVSDETTGYQGTLNATTQTLIKEEIQSVSIANKTDNTGKYTLKDQLVASIEPKGKDTEVIFNWYQEGQDKVISTGRNYTLKSSDVGKRLYVKATAKVAGELKGELVSSATAVVDAIENDKPDIANASVIKNDDITATVKMTVKDGLYRYGIATSKGGAIQAFPVLARANTETTITGLTAGTTYYIYVQRAGEEGYLDSAWSDDCLEVKTNHPHVTGDVVIHGNAVYNETLRATLENGVVGQTGTIKWYRLDENTERMLPELATGESYKTVEDDIGKKIEVVYEATGDYAGEIATSTETIVKEEKEIPDSNLTVNDSADTWIKVTMPTNSEGEKYIIGVSSTKDGTPIEVLENGKVKELAADETYTMQNLQRDSDHYLFVRYASNETHEKSNWIAADDAIYRKTSTTSFTGSLDFEYETNPAKLMVGQRITAKINMAGAAFNYKGEWKWYRIYNGTEVEVTDYTFTDDKQGTSYVIPEGTEIGTTYKVTFEATVGYDGSTEKTSAGVEPTVRAQYSKPDATKIVMETVDDSSIKVKMSEGDGLYRFYYKKAGGTSIIDSFVGLVKSVVGAADGYIDSGATVSSNTDVILEKLTRNTEYIVKVQRVEDNDGSESDFVYSVDENISATTQKTEIAGNVTITGSEKYNEKLTATYQKASYASTGSSDDSNGKWQWYRGNQAITNANSSIYTTTEDDVGQILKAEYKMASNDDFEGETSTATRTIEKAISQNPEVTNVVSQFDATSQQMHINITGTTSNGDAKVYYRVLPNGDKAPDFPDSSELSKWTESTSTTIKMVTDSDGRELFPQTGYVVYVIQTGTATNTASPVIAKQFTVGAKTQTGLIEYSGKTHVGKELTATLKDENNQVGEWHWYYSTTDYTNTSPSSWTELKSGFSPKDNSTVSTLLVPDEAKGKYIKAEFESTDEKHKGTVEGVTMTTVTKTFTEKLEISGKGYAGETITVKLTGSDRDLTQTGSDAVGPLFSTRVVQFQTKEGAHKFNITALWGETKDSFKVTVPSFGKSQGVSLDDSYLCAIINLPDTRIYTNEDGSPLNLGSSTYLHSSLEDRIPYRYGATIATANDLTKFIKGESPYNDRSASYVITNDINMSSLPKIAPSGTVFSGSLNGDYHTIVGIKNPIFQTVKGPAPNKAKIKRMIISNGNLVGTNMAIFAQYAGYVDVEEILIVDTDIRDSGDTGLLFAVASDMYAFSTGANVSLSKIGTAKGSLTQTSSAKSVGGMVAQFSSQNATNKANDLFSVNFTMNYTASSAVGGLFRNADKSIVKNTYAANKTNGSSPGLLAGIAPNVVYQNGTNNFYDRTFTTPSGEYDVTADNAQVGKYTKDMIGTKLSSSFGNTNWVYKDGYYPRLKWMVDRNIESATLYAATRGAFVPLDTKTTTTNLFDGNIYGAVSVPTELQKPGYTYHSSNPSALTISQNGVITPKTTGGAKSTISITYTDQKTGATPVATFEFASRASLSNFTDVSISGTPAIGNAFTASTTPTPTSTRTYKWYKKLGDGNRTLINGATSSTYQAQASDAGYQIQVEVSASGYGTMTSAWSDPIQVGAPASKPAITEISDSGAKITGNSGLGNYEFAYATSDTGEKIILDSQGASATLDRLARNTTYYVWARNAAGTGYSASDWSPSASFTTAQTDIVGEVILGSNINNGQQLSLSASTTNDQTGKWILERMSEDGTTKEADITFTETSNPSNYTLTNEDVGYRIKATFEGTVDYVGSISKMSEVVKKSNASAPISPEFVSSGDSSIVMKQIGTSKYDVGYASEANGEIFVRLTNQNGNTNLTLLNLLRNKDYYVYTRVASTSSAEESPWSLAKIMSTAKSAVSGDISIAGDEKTDAIITFTAPQTNNQTGLWKLERLEGASTTTISPSDYSVDNTGRVLSYTLTPKDAGAKMKATFTGNGDFNSSIETTTESIQKENQKEENFPLTTDIEISNIKDYALNIKTVSGEENYQFGYTLKDGLEGSMTTVEAVVGKGVPVTINGLQRNTEYDIYMRKASKTGYVAGVWHKMTTVKTDRSALTGSISYVIENADGGTVAAKPGIANVKVTYKATYAKGKYAQEGDDREAGTWQWYANGVEIPNATSNSYTIEPMLGNIEISVRYIAKAESDFKDTRNANIGTLTKPAFGAPTLPSVQALPEDGNAGSQLKIATAVHEDVFFYVQKSSNSMLPATVTAEDAKDNEEKANQWFKAKATNTLVLEADTEYIVYAAKLENGSNISSGVVSQRAVKTVKEDLDNMPSIKIEEEDQLIPWKVQQAKELRISNGGQAVDGSWKYYVGKEKTDSSWQNITSEIKNEVQEGKESDHSYTKVTIPLKYSNDYYVKVVFTGNGAYKGTKTYESSGKLVGTSILGHAEMTDSQQVSEIFVPIKVRYVFGKDEHSNPIVDEKNGVWTWYRETSVGSNAYKKIPREIDTVGLEDEYRPTAEDVDKKIYAVYTAAPRSLYSGSVQSQIFDNVERTSQNKPEAVTIKQVNGTTIQVNLPSNYKEDGKTVPQVVVEYRKKGEETWTKNQEGESWIGRGSETLDANTTYEVRTQYLATIEYKASEYSDIYEVKTSNQSFAEENLKVTQPSILESGTTIRATFTGKGYDEGYFVIKDTLDNTLVAKEEGTITGSSITMEYIATDASIGQNIIIQYVAKNDAKTYGGYIEKYTSEVLKLENPVKPSTPVLNTIRLAEDELKVTVNAEYEYVLDTSASPHDPASSKWQKLTPDAEGNYTFTGLQVDTNYYLHVRIAETATYRQSPESISAPTKTWQRSQYTITYIGVDEGGAINGTPPNPTQYTELDEDIVLREATKPGYTFIGWTWSGQTTPNKNVTIPSGSAENKTYTANWTVNEYTAKFDSNGGNESEQTITKKYQEELGVLPPASRTGYTLSGWFTAADNTGTEVETTTKMPLNGATYYAHWTAKKYTVTYDSKEGSPVSPQTVDYNSLVAKPEDPTRDGYRFAGWYTEDTSYATEWDFGTDKIAAQNMTLYAKWNQLYQLSFDKNTGVGQMVNVEFIQGESITLPKNTFTKEGFAFTGWNTQADGKGVDYTDEAVLNDLLTDTTLYATWKTQAPSVFIDIPKGLSLIDDKASNTAIKEDVVKIVKSADDVNWYPDEDIEIRASSSIILSNNAGSSSYIIDVYKADGSKYTDSELPLAVLNVKDEAKQSAKFTLKTPMNDSKPKDIYKGSMNFIIEFVPKP